MPDTAFAYGDKYRITVTKSATDNNTGVAALDDTSVDLETEDRGEAQKRMDELRAYYEEKGFPLETVYRVLPGFVGSRSGGGKTYTITVVWSVFTICKQVTI